jgi:hypothetical protein
VYVIYALTINAEPMNELGPDLLVPIEHTETVNLCGKNLPSYVGSIAALSKRVSKRHERGIMDLSRRARADLMRSISGRC